MLLMTQSVDFEDYFLKKVREVSQSRYVPAVTRRFRTPSKVSKELALHGAWSAYSTPSNGRRAGTFALSWLLGTVLMVYLMSPTLKGPRSLEVTTSLISYIVLWVSSAQL